jgi:phage shock protein A
MALLERVATLLRANVNDLMDKAEDPEKMLKQLLLDMENQLLQLKTQVAIGIADQHLLEQKKKEHEEAVTSWQRKAELAVKKDDEHLARAALDRSLSHQQLAEGFAQQIEDQRAEGETMRSNYNKLRQKFEETEARCDLLLARSRRARATARSGQAADGRSLKGVSRVMHRLESTIEQNEVQNAARALVQSDPDEALEDRFRRLEREDKIEALLEGIKSRPKLLAD